MQGNSLQFLCSDCVLALSFGTCTEWNLIFFLVSLHGLRVGHDKACDYWSWAILIHEMCTGDTPFQDHGADQMTLFKGIVKGKYRISSRASKEVSDLVKKILEIKPQYRLGNLAGGAKDIKTHKWLKDVNFNKLSKKVFRAPWTPTIKDPLDVEAFDNWDHMEKDERECPLTGKEQKLFAELDKIQKV